MNAVPVVLSGEHTNGAGSLAGDEEELDEIRADYIRLAKEARAALLQKGAGISREGSPGV